MRKYAFVSIFFFIFVFFICVNSNTKIPNNKNVCLFYSNQKNDNLKSVFINFIKKAKKSIVVHTFCINDADIIKLLQKKANENVSVIIICDASNPRIKLKSNIDIKYFKAKGLMHEKILVIDENLILLGSSNLTYSSLHMHDNFLIGFFDKNFGEFLIKKSSQKIQKITENKNDFDFKIKNQELTFYSFPDIKNKAENELIETIKNAKKIINIAMFTFTHKNIANYLIEAKNRGIDVNVILDYYTSKAASLKILKILKENNIKVYINEGIELFHYKLAQIDEDLIIGSANWTKAAFKKNHDYLMKLKKLSKTQKKDLKKLWDVMKKQSI